MEKVLHDILNAGIALFRAGEDSVNNAVKEVQRTFDELKSKGAADTSDAAVKLRKTLDDIVAQANDLSGKAGGAYGESLAKLDGLYKNAIEQIKAVVPEDKLNELKDKIEELTQVIKEKTGQGGSASA
ncbi:MAG: chemotaxis protein [Leptospiraceae bacterium]|nr:chemotaxis protein [Leptospiraceae bacterium]